MQPLVRSPRVHTRSLMRVAAVLLGVLVFIGVVFALLVTMQGSTTGLDDGGISRLGWMMPVVVALLIGVMCWVMLARRKAEDDSPRDLVGCVSCGAKVMRGWRMCPYCGRLTEDQEAAGE